VLGTFSRFDVVIVCEPCAGRLTARPAHQIKVPLPSATVQSPRRRWPPTPPLRASRIEWPMAVRRQSTGCPPSCPHILPLFSRARPPQQGLAWREGKGSKGPCAIAPLVGCILCGQCSPRTARYDTGKADLWRARPGADAIFGSFFIKLDDRSNVPLGTGPTQSVLSLPAGEPVARSLLAAYTGIPQGASHRQARKQGLT
jgi:hypothetical protein